jgi:hypothetical protein
LRIPKQNQTDRTSTPVLDLTNFRHYLGTPGEENQLHFRERIEEITVDAVGVV